MTQALALLEQLVAANTVGAHEDSLVSRCRPLLDAAGFTSAVAQLGDGRSQLVSALGGDAPLTFTGHLDTVPASPQDWSSDPWTPTRRGDRLHGRGTSDMKSGVAALLVAATRHAATQHDCRGVQVVLTAGEETGCTGALALDPGLLRRGGPLVVAEPTANRMVLAHKGALWLRLSAHGVAAHGSAPELGDNAVVILARAAVALHDADDWPSEPGFGAVTANVGVLRGGVQTNVVPDAAHLLLDLRRPPSVTSEALLDRVRARAGEGVRVRVEVDLPPVDTSPEAELTELTRETLTAASMDATAADPARYFTDASVLATALSTDGVPVPTVVLGPGEPEQCHVADEWCSIERLEASVEVYADLLRRWCAR